MSRGGRAWRAAVVAVVVITLLAAPWLRMDGHDAPSRLSWISPDDERLITGGSPGSHTRSPHGSASSSRSTGFGCGRYRSPWATYQS